MTDKEIVIENEELDFSSERFNPLEALTRPDDQVVLPVPEAPVFDNLGQFISAVTGRARTGQQPQHDASSGPCIGRSSGNLTGGLQRRFLPHQEPVMGRGRSRPLRNLLTRMDEVTVGPLSVLRRCMVDKIRVKVWIRSAKWIRGWCLGYVAAFDKQWNLALTDVDETFTRKRRRKTPVYGPVELIAEAFQSLNTVEADEEKETEEAPPPPPSEKEEEEEEEEDLTGLVVIRRTGRTTEECQRHVQQLFIRGEQIALVAVVPL